MENYFLGKQPTDKDAVPSPVSNAGSLQLTLLTHVSAKLGDLYFHFCFRPNCSS